LSRKGAAIAELATASVVNRDAAIRKRFIKSPSHDCILAAMPGTMMAAPLPQVKHFSTPNLGGILTFRSNENAVRI
jgi:hypothetical protein